MSKTRLPKSVRKFLRQEKARLRRETYNSQEAEKAIQELVAKIRKRYFKEEYEKLRENRRQTRKTSVPNTS